MESREEEEDEEEDDSMEEEGQADKQSRVILADACQGWIRHARGFDPRCLARASIACDV